MKFIWECDNWTNFRWNNDKIINKLSLARKKQGYILGLGEKLDFSDISEIITLEAITTSKIEGEVLDKASVRSSVANRLGLSTAGLPKTNQSTDGLVEILLDATTNYYRKLTDKRIFGWHAALFPTGYSGIHAISVAQWRKGDTPMEVVSGILGNTKIHYVAPPSSIIPKEMEIFFSWWETTTTDAILKSAIAHFWFVTIHPFDDGNGRISRVLSDMALAQDEKTGKRLYSLSNQILEDKKSYYNILEITQKGDGDITLWLDWYLGIYERSIDKSLKDIDIAIKNNNFLQQISMYNLNPRQIKVITKLIEKSPEGFEGGLTNKKYVSINKTSPETAKRDIKTLVDLGLLAQNSGKGRSTSYRLNL